jgi:hypothetical protein
MLMDDTDELVILDDLARGLLLSGMFCSALWLFMRAGIEPLIFLFMSIAGLVLFPKRRAPCMLPDDEPGHKISGGTWRRLGIILLGGANGAVVGKLMTGYRSPPIPELLAYSSVPCGIALSAVLWFNVTRDARPDRLKKLLRLPGWFVLGALGLVVCIAYMAGAALNLFVSDAWTKVSALGGGLGIAAGASGAVWAYGLSKALVGIMVKKRHNSATRADN